MNDDVEIYHKIIEIRDRLILEAAKEIDALGIEDLGLQIYAALELSSLFSASLVSVQDNYIDVNKDLIDRHLSSIRDRIATNKNSLVARHDLQGLQHVSCLMQ